MCSTVSHFNLSSMVFATVFLLGCVALALPVSSDAASKHDLKNLMSLLGKLKDANRLRHSSLEASSSLHSGAKDSQQGNHKIPHDVLAKEAAMLLSSHQQDEDSLDSDYDFDNEDDDAEDENASVVSKRQGSWSFDYGLGGGRFGKRGGYAYPEYGLGGGRFGRDVAHVKQIQDQDKSS